jgi:hypothetical protein
MTRILVSLLIQRIICSSVLLNRSLVRPLIPLSRSLYNRAGVPDAYTANVKTIAGVEESLNIPSGISMRTLKRSLVEKYNYDLVSNSPKDVDMNVYFETTGRFKIDYKPDHKLSDLVSQTTWMLGSTGSLSIEMKTAALAVDLVADPFFWFRLEAFDRPDFPKPKIRKKRK